ncbi:MAG TPA: hypothetical protein VNH65_06090 [Candidatus Acidoferrum sp.]|nr:hypothetical protein [Candidatus Acidoferrum sp.]
MLFGHNSDVKVGETVFHVQTEDRGTANALIDTTVYCRGRVLHRRTNNYFDLLPLGSEHENLLRKRIDDQHRTVVEEIRTGALHLVPPPLPVQESTASKKQADSAGHPAVSHSPALALELINAKSWLAGKRANLHLAVRKKQNGAGVPGALVTARVDGAANITEHSTETGADGQARLEFDMPKLAGADPALVIEATQGDSKGQLKFQLRARPRIPTA